MEACERLATRVRRATRFRVYADGKFFQEKYNGFTMAKARQLQCKALRKLQKIRRRNNNGKQWKKQCAE
jgi:hypothetical protein